MERVRPGNDIMANKFDQFRLIQLGYVPKPSPYFDRTFFFYGTLAAEDTLQKFLRLGEMPKFEDAHIRGFVTEMRGEYPALIRTRNPKDVVYGRLWAGTSQYLEPLKDYGDQNYSLVVTPVFVGEYDENDMVPGPKVVCGTTFLWAEKPEGPRDLPSTK